MHATSWSQNQKEKGFSKNLVIDGSRILMGQDESVRAGFI
jgi:hypothetical protein